VELKVRKLIVIVDSIWIVNITARYHHFVLALGRLRIKSFDAVEGDVIILRIRWVGCIETIGGNFIIHDPDENGFGISFVEIDDAVQISSPAPVGSVGGVEVLVLGVVPAELV